MVRLKIKTKKIMLVTLVALVILAIIIWKIDLTPKQTIWGFTWSAEYAKELGLDWQKGYVEALTDLGFKKVRLVAYWDAVEAHEGTFDFSELDWQVEEASKRGTEVVVTLGYRVPRWPECHTPDWADNLSDADFDKKLNSYVKTLVEHYKSDKRIMLWQVENEPFLSVYGSCKKIPKKILKERIALVRETDELKRPIMTTDSGELSVWFRMYDLSEVFGTTLYRVVWNPYIGWFHELYPPYAYTFRATLLKFFSPKTKKVVISELQAEPWTANSAAIQNIPLDEQIRNFSTKELSNTMSFAQRTGIEEIYLWGVEWWYYRKAKGDDTFWQTAKDVIRNEN